MSSTVRVRVGGTDLLEDGKMKEIPFPKEDSESKILLSKVREQFPPVLIRLLNEGSTILD
jgi:hypothetical protein